MLDTAFLDRIFTYTFFPYGSEKSKCEISATLLSNNRTWVLFDQWLVCFSAWFPFWPMDLLKNVIIRWVGTLRGISNNFLKWCSKSRQTGCTRPLEFEIRTSNRAVLISRQTALSKEGKSVSVYTVNINRLALCTQQINNTYRDFQVEWTPRCGYSYRLEHK